MCATNYVLVLIVCAIRKSLDIVECPRLCQMTIVVNGDGILGWLIIQGGVETICTSMNPTVACIWRQLLGLQHRCVPHNRQCSHAFLDTANGLFLICCCFRCFRLGL